MNQNIKHISLVVDDYDKAIDFYTKKLNFELVEDTKLSEEKRWVLIKPKGTSDFSLLLAKASNEIQKSRIGNQAGGRVFLFLNTDDFDRDFKNLQKQNIKIVRGPSFEDYGKVAVFEDFYGNLWDLIEPKTNEQTSFYVSRTLRVKELKNINFVKNELLALKTFVKNKLANSSLDIYQAKENAQIFTLWVYFKDENTFEQYLKSEFYKKLTLMVEFESEIISEKLI